MSFRKILFFLLLCFLPVFSYAVCPIGGTICGCLPCSTSPSPPTSVSISSPSPQTFSISWTNGSGTSTDDLFWDSVSSGSTFEYAPGTTFTSYNEPSDGACCPVIYVTPCGVDSSGKVDCASSVSITLTPPPIGGGVAFLLKKLWFWLLRIEHDSV